MKRKQFVQSIVGGWAGLLGSRSFLGFTSSLRSHPISKLNLRSQSVESSDERFWSVIRDQFPLTHDRAYFNTGGLGASPFVVIETVKRKMDELEAVSEVGHTEEAWAAIKEKAARILGCEPAEVSLTSCATEGIDIVVNGLPLKRGDEVITTTHEHVGASLLGWRGKSLMALCSNGSSRVGQAEERTWSVSRVSSQSEQGSSALAISRPRQVSNCL